MTTNQQTYTVPQEEYDYISYGLQCFLVVPFDDPVVIGNLITLHPQNGSGQFNVVCNHIQIAGSFKVIGFSFIVPARVERSPFIMELKELVNEFRSSHVSPYQGDYGEGYDAAKHGSADRLQEILTTYGYG